MNLKGCVVIILSFRKVILKYPSQLFVSIISFKKYFSWISFCHIVTVDLCIKYIYYCLQFLTVGIKPVTSGGILK